MTVRTRLQCSSDDDKYDNICYPCLRIGALEAFMKSMHITLELDAYIN